MWDILGDLELPVLVAHRALVVVQQKLASFAVGHAHALPKLILKIFQFLVCRSKDRFGSTARSVETHRLKQEIPAAVLTRDGFNIKRFLLAMVAILLHQNHNIFSGAVWLARFVQSHERVASVCASVFWHLNKGCRARASATHSVWLEVEVLWTAV